MERRSDQLRARDRKVLGWALVAAVGVHVAIFALSPTFRTTPMTRTFVELDSAGVPGGANAIAEILFGPPRIRVAGGSEWIAPPDRVLPAEREIRLKADCLGLADPGRAPARGGVHLRVRESGRVDVVGMPEGTGDACADRVLKEVASHLWYHWIPDERFPAPIDLVQPVALLGVDRVDG